MTDKHGDVVEVLSLPLLDRDGLSRDHEDKLIQRYRNFRLNALKNDPDVFASSYAEENGQPVEYWRSRLANPLAVNLVALPARRGENWSEIELLETEWSGMIVLLGPLAEDTSASDSPWSKVPSVAFNQSSMEASATTGRPDPETVVYHISGAYTTAPHRRKGVGKALLKTSLLKAENDCRRRNGRYAKLGVHVDTCNAAATQWYEKHGFKIISEETYPPRPSEVGPRLERKAFLMQAVLTV